MRPLQSLLPSARDDRAKSTGAVGAVDVQVEVPLDVSSCLMPMLEPYGGSCAETSLAGFSV